MLGFVTPPDVSKSFMDSPSAWKAKCRTARIPAVGLGAALGVPRRRLTRPPSSAVDKSSSPFHVAQREH